MKTVKIHEAKTHLSRLIAEVEAGAEIVIARGNKPVVRMIAVPAVTKEPRVFGSLKGQIGPNDGAEALKPLPDDIIELMTTDRNPASA